MLEIVEVSLWSDDSSHQILHESRRAGSDPKVTDKAACGCVSRENDFNCITPLHVNEALVPVISEADYPLVVQCNIHNPSKDSLPKRDLFMNVLYHFSDAEAIGVIIPLKDGRIIV